MPCLSIPERERGIMQGSASLTFFKGSMRCVLGQDIMRPSGVGHVVVVVTFGVIVCNMQRCGLPHLPQSAQSVLPSSRGPFPTPPRELGPGSGVCGITLHP